jgi:hypothetical protein
MKSDCIKFAQNCHSPCFNIVLTECRQWGRGRYITDAQGLGRIKGILLLKISGATAWAGEGLQSEPPDGDLRPTLGAERSSSGNTPPHRIKFGFALRAIYPGLPIRRQRHGAAWPQPKVGTEIV